MLFDLSTKFSSLLLVIGWIQSVNANPAGCCSNNYKNCDVGWCGSTKSSCESCGGDRFIFLENGENSGDSCLARWTGYCNNHASGCCDGLVCKASGPYYSQCLPGEAEDEDDEEDAPEPTLQPVTVTDPPVEPTLQPVTVTNPPVEPTLQPVTVTDPPVDPPANDDNNCLARWSACKNNPTGCCDGNVCVVKNPWYSQCLEGQAEDEGDDDEEDDDEDTPRPSLRATSQPSKRPTASPVRPEDDDDISDCGCPSSCNQAALDRLAGEWNCGSRIAWTIDNRPLSVLESCALIGEEFPSICGVCNPNTCSNEDPSPTPPPQSDDGEWDGNDLVLTHYWDCSGQSCDSGTLSPWNYNKYRSPAGYQPQDPNDFGGPSEYGEKLWVTAAIVNIDQGPDDGCCGGFNGGCGKCLLIQNPDSLHPDWNILAMKKNTCGNCGNNKHADINVPGFDVLEYSLANICGQSGTGLSKSESTVLGQWYQNYSNIAEAGQDLCGQLPQEFQKGCSLFSEWGWTGGTTSRARYKVVDCPQEFKDHIGSLFDENGVVVN